MLLICVSDVADRFHGFLRSVMLNPHPGVYLAMDLDAGSRQRIWDILNSWWEAEPTGMGIMLWRDPARPMGIALDSFGAPKRRIVSFAGHWALVRMEEGLHAGPARADLDDAGGHEEDAAPS